ncbi:response regulator [Rhizobium leucaenae]|uniref:histidine kinase n=1 Tax=Rhizobium leucaenae TaxID=29450 RepID=A0A7W7EID7_9HYPH|nr:response regulator [Rhizobium leucaenae]MBB4566102.1 PAS domain S-box-containing protein [Rhizobium leucaenae]MBB6302271.1 PAS domain S-box-containing protein [Rhizobium leucaenae]
MNSDGELLEMACRRIADLDQPAYVKNSDLRYVAVNEAYARFFRRDLSDFIGNRSRDLFDSGEEADREDKERRALVFGSEEMALCFDPTGCERSRVQIESFSPSEDCLYVFGMFLDAPAAPSRSPSGRESGDIPGDVDEIGLYRTILEDLPVAAFVRDASHRLIYSNEAYAAITGLSRAEVLGKTEQEMFETGGDDYFAENEQVLTEGRALEFEGTVVDRKHVTHPIMTRVNRVVTSDGKRYAVGSMTDISVLKLRETELIEAQARAEALHQDLQNILRSMPIGVMIHDGNYVVEYTNDAFYDIWEFPKDERFEGRSYRDLVAKHFELGRYDVDAGSIDDIYQARLESFRKAGPHFQIEMNFADGKSVIMDASRISNGRTLVAYADISSVRQQAREITEARLALERLGELMTDATRAMSQGLLIVEDGIIMLTNDAARDMLRIPADHLTVGQHWFVAFDHCAARGDFGENPHVVRRAWRRSMAAGKPVSAVFQVAGERWMQLEAAMSESGRWTVVLTDVTEMKEREAELQLLLSRSEAADRAKSEFLANMSHEIRTPMNGVLGMAELLAKTDLDARQKTFIDIIVKSGNALLTIINDILDFSKIDAGQMRLRKAAFDPADAVEDVATLLSSPAAEKDIELLVRMAPDVPAMVLGDAGRFRQIVTNLVGNAVKFTERGHVLVEVDSRPIDNGEIMLTLRIEDTGIGIPDEKLDTIFEKFSQVDASSTRRHEGTGLGLAITAGLVDLFGGYLEVESEWGKGSVFTVHLPMPPAATRSEPRPVPVNVKGAGILVVDDNEINRRILTEQLAQWSFDGYAAADGKTGLAILRAAFDMGVPVDAVILDYHMPGMNGDDVARAIRADSRFDKVSLIFLTSMDVASSDKEFAALNGQAHLMKPARANVLRNTIIDVVRTARRQRMSGDDTPAAAPPSIEVEAVAAIDAVERGVATKPVNAIDILVAEDNEVNQIVFTQILQVTGLRFLVVQNGLEAVDAWRKLRPSLIMMDVSMPIMNGHQATRMIRQLEAEAGQGWHVPIVGVTAHALDVDRDMCLEAGMDDYMSKPISPELLEAKARRWLGDGMLQTERSTK